MGGREGSARTEGEPAVVALPAELSAANAWSVGKEIDSEMDRIYEKWITAVSESSGYRPVLLVPDPDRAAPGMFRLFSTGPALLRFAEGLNGFCSSRPEGLSEEHADLISNFFGILQDWITNSGDQNSIQAEPDVSWALDRQMKELAKDGFAVGARERFLLLTGGMDATPLPWRIVDIKVLPAAPV